MSKIDLSDITSGYNVSKINENFQKIEDALNDEVLFRDNPDDEDNSIQTDTDYNNKRILNLPEPESAGEPIRKYEWDQSVGLAESYRDEAEEYRDEAEQFAEESEAWSEVAKSVAGDDSLVVVSSIENASSTVSVLSEGRRVTVAGYHEGATVGGGEFVIGTGVHNGGTFISTARDFPTDWSDQSQLDTWFALGSESELCLIRVNYNYPTIAMFGAKSDVTLLGLSSATDNYYSIQTAMNVCLDTSLFIPRGDYKYTQKLQVPSTYGFRMFGVTSLSVDSPVTGEQIGSKLYAVGCDGIDLGNISETEKVNNIKLENFSIVGDETEGTTGVLSSGQAGFHGNFRFVGIHVEYFDEGMWTNILGWLYMDNCIFQNNTKGCAIQCNIVNIQNSLFYQNERYELEDLDTNNFSQEYIESLPYGLYVRGTSVVLTANDYEANTVPLRIGYNADLGPCGVTINGGYFEDSRMCNIYAKNASVTLNGLLTNTTEGISYYFENCEAEFNTSPLVSVIANRSKVRGLDTCPDSTINHIYTDDYSQPTDWTVEKFIRTEQYAGLPNKPNQSWRTSQLNSQLDFTLTNAVGSVETVSYGEPDKNSYLVTSSGGSGIATYVISVGTTERSIAGTISFKASSDTVRFILSISSYVMDITLDEIEKDDAGISTFSFIVNNVTPTANGSLIIHTGDDGETFEILGFNYKVSENSVFSDFLPLPDYMKTYQFAAPSSGSYYSGQTIVNKGWSSGEAYMWIYDGTSWQGVI